MPATSRSFKSSLESNSLIEQLIYGIEKAGDDMSINQEFEEIYLERLRYLVSLDDMIEKMLEEQHGIIYDVQANLQMKQVLSQQSGIRADAELAQA